MFNTGEVLNSFKFLAAVRINGAVVVLGSELDGEECSITPHCATSKRQFLELCSDYYDKNQHDLDHSDVDEILKVQKGQ